MEKVYKFLNKEKTVRASFVVTTQTITQIAHYQKLAPLPSIALGRAVTGCILLASHLKEGQILSTHFKGNGPLKSIFVEASYEMEVRGYCEAPEYYPTAEADFFSVGKGLGKGTLSIARFLPNQTQPQTGIVPLFSGEIAEDLAFYQMQSQQIPSIVSLGVSLNHDAKVKNAGGFLIELLPGAPEKKVEELESKIKNIPRVSKILEQAGEPTEIFQSVFDNETWFSIAHDYKIKYVCRCSEERVLRALMLLPAKDLQHLIERGKDAEIKCEFCQNKYVVPLQKLISFTTN